MKTKALVLAVVVAAGILGIRVRESNGVVVEPNGSPFRDSSSVGRLSAERGDSGGIGVGRGSEGKDRQSFAEGYRLAQGDMIAKRRRNHRPDVPKLTAAGYSDGLYQGRT
jgi:hypothetical protein